MSKTFIILSLFTQYLHISHSLRGLCVPNSQFIVNGLVCYCDKFGHWSEENCKLNFNIDRRALCKPGTILWQGCSYCICKEDGQLYCSENACSNDPDVNNANVHRSLSKVIDWCTPFKYYYVNCNVCICPASGRTVEARCTVDSSCKDKSNLFHPTSDLTAKKSECIPKVMYLFPCLHCLCSDAGLFTHDKCVETCKGHQTSSLTQKCVSGRLYKHDCNVCKCPEHGIRDHKSCTKISCDKEKTKYEKSLRNQVLKCTPYTFDRPRCLYCDCTPEGTVDENDCYELGCLETLELKYDQPKDKCNPGEVVALCVECLCLRHGQTTEKYCSRSCTYEGKLRVLERFVKDSQNNKQLMDKTVIKKNLANDACQPNTVYKENGRYCLCPDIGATNFNLCVSLDKSNAPKPKENQKRTLDINMKCEPYTYVDFDCNSCFCSKHGTIDPKWCTYDDCQAKKTVQDSHAHSPRAYSKDLNSQHCTPGLMFKVKCNFCICPSNGRIKDRVCTKNTCAEVEDLRGVSNDNLVCEPLAYYEVDCNVCYCPHDGIKNIAKCTKNHCEKSFLRSDTCVPGQLFTDECNVCICPPNGNKEGKVCTDYTCADTAPWHLISQFSKSLIEDPHNVGHDAIRKLDLCFPGEEFTDGCKLCVCPDMGLRYYAICSPMSCDDGKFSDKTREARRRQQSNDTTLLDSPDTTSNKMVQETTRNSGFPSNKGSEGNEGNSDIVNPGKGSVPVNPGNLSFPSSHGSNQSIPSSQDSEGSSGEQSNSSNEESIVQPRNENVAVSPVNHSFPNDHDSSNGTPENQNNSSRQDKDDPDIHSKGSTDTRFTVKASQAFLTVKAPQAQASKPGKVTAKSLQTIKVP